MNAPTVYYIHRMRALQEGEGKTRRRRRKRRRITRMGQEEEK
jgi:hypothetical protein